MNLHAQLITISLLSWFLTLPIQAAETAPSDTRPLFEFDLKTVLADSLKQNPQSVAAIADPSAPTGAPALRWETADTGEAVQLSGDIPWSKAKFIAMDVYYDADQAGMMQFRFYAKEEKGPRLTAAVSLFPRLRSRVTIPMELLDAQKVFMPRTPGRLKGVISGRRIAPADIARVALALEKTDGKQRIFISRLALLETDPSYPLPDQEIVDEFGQWTAKTWPGKTPDEATLKQQITSAHRQAKTAAFPSQWSRFGGYKAKTFKATGFFRSEHDGARWWLVDPEGCGFFSAGLDCIRAGEGAAILPGTEKLFQWLPERHGAFSAAFGRNYGATYTFDFGRANLIRAFGDTWRIQWAEMVRGRLIDWRFNTIGNWSELDLLKSTQLPYVTQLGRYPTTPTLLFRDFPDVYDLKFRESAAQYAKQLEPFKEDPFLIGYFLSNEPVWGFGKNNLAAEMLEANPGTATRKELARWVQAKYGNDVGAWSKAWGRDFNAFAQLETGLFRRVGDTSQKAYEDLWEFSREMVRAYVRIPCEEVKKVDPHHLNLGMRYAWISSDLMYAAGEYFDVFSINCYQMEPAFESINLITQKSGKPVIIGEYHFGALDRGLPATGLRGVASQAERGVAYRRYLESGAANPNLVGAHYFILNDQALLGRFDGENYQIGFVDCCHTPYAELVEQARQAHENMYAVRLGEKPPFGQKARETSKIK